MQIVDDILKHYGVPGMRWGFRKSESSSAPSASTMTLAPKKKPSANLVPRTVVEFHPTDRSVKKVLVAVPNSELSKYNSRPTTTLRVPKKTMDEIKKGKQTKPLMVNPEVQPKTAPQPTGKKAPSADAKEAAAIKFKAKQGGSKQVLTNEEIRTLVNRQNLEQQYSKLNPKQKSMGEKFLKLAMKEGPMIGLSMAKMKYKDTKENPLDPKIKQYLELGDMFVKQMNAKNQKK